MAFFLSVHSSGFTVRFKSLKLFRNTCLRDRQPVHNFTPDEHAEIAETSLWFQQEPLVQRNRNARDDTR